MTFARQLNVPILGIVENMAGMVCPHCGEKISVFDGGAGRIVATNMGVPFLGSIPLDPSVSRDSDEGKPFVVEHPDSPSSKEFQVIVEKVLKIVEK